MPRFVQARFVAENLQFAQPFLLCSDYFPAISCKGIRCTCFRRQKGRQYGLFSSKKHWLLTILTNFRFGNQRMENLTRKNEFWTSFYEETLERSRDDMQQDFLIAKTLSSQEILQEHLEASSCNHLVQDIADFSRASPLLG